MKITIEILKKVWPTAEFINLSDNEEFDYVNIAKIQGQNVDTDKHLFFAIHETEPQVEGWYLDKIDRRLHFPKITYDKPHWTFVIESTEKHKLKSESKVIIVESVNQCIKELYRFVLSIVKPKVCAVTGSVGKTTTVSLLEDIISIKYKCLRIYSKRITPFILFSSIINKLEIDTKYIVLEFGLYRKEHIIKLSELLPPDISVMLNILKIHIGINGIQNQEQILHAKTRIIIEGSTPVLNIGDKYISTINHDNAITFSSKSRKGDIHLVSSKGEELTIKCKTETLTVKPYILTDLTVNQILVAIAIAHFLKIDLGIAQSKINDFKPKEHRIGKYYYKGKTLIFDGDVSHSARLGELGNNYYRDTTLIIANLDFSEENAYYIIPDLFDTFKKFSRVRLLKNLKNTNQLNGYVLPKNTKFVEQTDLCNDVPDDGTIILHYSKYFREKNVHELEVSDILF